MILLYIFLENTNKSVTTESKSMVALGKGESEWGGEGEEGWGYRSAQENFRGDGYICYLGCGDNFTSVDMSKIHHN